MLPPIAATIAEVRQAVADARRTGKTIGLVPTMGALHVGHAALIRAARIGTDFNVVSIFVNPTQFGPNEDLDRYPRTLDADRELCGAVGADLLFVPAASEVYPAGYSTFVEVDRLGDHLCGASRPGHFRGVATVVLKLFNMVGPDVAYFGRKDAQQARIIERMTSDLNVSVRIDLVPTVREADGLALSSRNRYLSPEDRRNATVLHRSLEMVKRMVDKGERDVAGLEGVIAGEVAATPGARLDYARIVDADSLQPIGVLDRPALCAIAVYFGATRLIDNVNLTP